MAMSDLLHQAIDYEEAYDALQEAAEKTPFLECGTIPGGGEWWNLNLAKPGHSFLSATPPVQILPPPNSPPLPPLPPPVYPLYQNVTQVVTIRLKL
jgi:hypothetical protein